MPLISLPFNVYSTNKHGVFHVSRSLCCSQVILNPSRPMVNRHVNTTYGIFTRRDRSSVSCFSSIYECVSDLSYLISSQYPSQSGPPTSFPAPSSIPSTPNISQYQVASKASVANASSYTFSLVHFVGTSFPTIFSELSVTSLGWHGSFPRVRPSVPYLVTTGAWGCRSWLLIGHK